MARKHTRTSYPTPQPRAHARNEITRAQSGFTLLELAIVLTIIAMIMGGGLSLYTERLLVERVRETNTRLDRVEEALTVYVKTFGTLPCPAIGNVGIDQTTLPSGVKSFGRQTCDATPYGQLAVANSTRTTAGYGNRYVLVGAVPTRTLGLADSYAFDGWNNRIMYGVDNEYSYGTTGAQPSWGPANGAIRMWGYNDADEKTNCGGDCPGMAGGVYVLWSFGQNGYGAWRDKATTTSARNLFAFIGSIAGTTKERYNAHINSGATEAYTVNFRDSLPKQTDNEATYFDDLVRWKTRLNF